MEEDAVVEQQQQEEKEEEEQLPEEQPEESPSSVGPLLAKSASAESTGSKRGSSGKGTSSLFTVGAVVEAVAVAVEARVVADAQPRGVPDHRPPA